MRHIYLDYFRAISIIIIIAGHSYGSWLHESLAGQSVANMVTGGTALFVFISGFFFKEIFCPRFKFSKFMNKKLQTVLLPYVLLSFAGMALKIVVEGDLDFPITFHADPLYNNLLSVPANLITGRTLTAYWYIPFAMLIFVASPAIIRLLALPQKTVIALTMICFALSMQIHRPEMNLNPVHAMVYYFPFYMLGAIYSTNRQQADDWIRANLPALGVAFVCVAVAMNFGGQTGNATKANPLLWTGIDHMVLQKGLLISVLLGLCKKLESARITPLSYIAGISFALFFLHPWVLSVIAISGLDAHLVGLPGFVARALIALIASIAVAELVRAALKQRSRFVIGY